MCSLGQVRARPAFNATSAFTRMQASNRSVHSFPYPDETRPEQVCHSKPVMQQFDSLIKPSSTTEMQPERLYVAYRQTAQGYDEAKSSPQRDLVLPRLTPRV